MVTKLDKITKAYNQLEEYLEEINFTHTGWRLMDNLSKAIREDGEDNDNE